ncbi:unnamed protein product [Allacma fusca]|uniref:Uncharacterized protein n=1 Tax=Allacma fusca TaxID=39272 RepID=A0A8J2Q2F8_9HEXA|nr:unnamed protein product [Allacma fusca]
MEKNSKVHPLHSTNTNESIASSKAFGLTPFKYLADEPPKRHTINKETPPQQQPGSKNTSTNSNASGQSGQQPLASTSGDRPSSDGQPRIPFGQPDKEALSQSGGILNQQFETKDDQSESAKEQSDGSGAPLPEELLLLEETTMLFVVKQLKPMKFQKAVPMLQYFKIFNQRGEHILSAGEVKISRCVKFSKYEFLCFVFTTDGVPFITIAQRNESFRAFTKSQKKDWLIHHQADDWLNRKYRLVIGDDVDDRKAHVHASLVTGAFLGHIWGNGDQFIIHDIEYNPNISIVRRELAQLETVVLPKNERRISAFNESLATSCDVKYELYVETAQVGEICANVKFEENNNFGSNKPEHCVGAIFPLHFEVEEKALLLAFLLYYNRTDTISLSNNKIRQWQW